MASYSDTELQEIARWLREGLSASKIAAAFSMLRAGPVSRNAIIGIVHRNATLAAIGFANGRGVPPRAAVARQAARQQPASRQAGSRPPDGMRAKGKAKANAAAVADLHATGIVRREPPARLPPRSSVREAGVLIADGRAYRLEAPTPQRGPLGPQPHGVAMRFIDCLFGRCRAPLDLTLDDDPPGADMLCCGMRTKAMKSYCGYHQARFRRRVCEAV